MCEEWSRCEYEISVGNIFITEIKDVVKKIEQGKLTTNNVYDELKQISQRNFDLEKWDCFSQAKPNMEIIAREVIYQYKQQLKEGVEDES